MGVVVSFKDKDLYLWIFDPRNRDGPQILLNFI